LHVRSNNCSQITFSDQVSTNFHYLPVFAQKITTVMSHPILHFQTPRSHTGAPRRMHASHCQGGSWDRVCLWPPHGSLSGSGARGGRVFRVFCCQYSELVKLARLGAKFQIWGPGADETKRNKAGHVTWWWWLLLLLSKVV